MTEGSLQTIMSGAEIDPPIMQILGHKKISTGSANERYRLLVSDGLHLNSFAMLATQLNNKIISGELADNSIIRVNRHIISSVNSTPKGPNKRVLIILDLTVLANGDDVGSKLGDPVPMPDIPLVGSPSKPTVEQTAGSGTAASSVVSGDPSLSFNSNSSRVTGSNMSNISPINMRTSSGELQASHPIAALNPFHTKWIIKARVTSKSNIRTWSNARGEGKLFSVDLTDESGAIRATGFNDQCDKFYELLELEKIFFISKAQLKPANKKFTSLKHEFEMSFTNDTQIIPSYDRDDTIPHLQYEFVSMNTLKDAETESFVDVIGVCQQCTDVQSLVARQSRRELKKRDITLVDQTLASVTVTLWASQAEEFDGSLQPVVAIKGGRISEFGGSKSVGMGSSTVMQINPDIPEAHRLRGWFDSLPSNVQFSSVSIRLGDGMQGKIMTFQEAFANGIGSNPEKADYFNVEGTVLYIKSDSALYQACPNAGCQKKVIDQNNGMYRCEKCSQEFPNFKYRLMLNVQIGDWSGAHWVTIFQDAAELLLNGTAEEIGNSRDNMDDYTTYFQKPLFKDYVFRIRAKMDTYNNESRLRMSVVGVKPLNYLEACKRIMGELKTLTGVTVGAN